MKDNMSPYDLNQSLKGAWAVEKSVLPKGTLVYHSGNIYIFQRFGQILHA